MRILARLGSGLFLAAALSLAIVAVRRPARGPFGSDHRIYRVGDAVRLQSHVLRVAGAVVDYRSEAPQDRPRSPSDCFLVVPVTIWNTGDSDLPLNSLAFELDDGGRERRQMTLVVGLPEPLQSVILPPGTQVSGNLAFEVRRDDERRILVYHGDLVGDRDVRVDLTRRNPRLPVGGIVRARAPAGVGDSAHFLHARAAARPQPYSGGDQSRYRYFRPPQAPHPGGVASPPRAGPRRRMRVRGEPHPGRPPAGDWVTGRAGIIRAGVSRRLSQSTPSVARPHHLLGEE